MRVGHIGSQTGVTEMRKVGFELEWVKSVHRGQVIKGQSGHKRGEMRKEGTE